MQCKLIITDIKKLSKKVKGVANPIESGKVYIFVHKKTKTSS